MKVKLQVFLHIPMDPVFHVLWCLHPTRTHTGLQDKTERPQHAYNSLDHLTIGQFSFLIAYQTPYVPAMLNFSLCTFTYANPSPGNAFPHMSSWKLASAQMPPPLGTLCHFPLAECTALTSTLLRHNSNPKMEKFLFYFHYLITRLPSPFKYELLEERNSHLIIFEFPEPNTGLSHSKCLINVCGKNETRP